MRQEGEAPFRLDSPRPSIPLKDYPHNALRVRSLATARPAEAAALLAQARAAVVDQTMQYAALAMRDGSRFHAAAPGA
jgi:pyruvate-ferredoxin/flavodoxin oxidoreductase